MNIRREYITAITDHALEDNPDECCGILATLSGEVRRHYRIRNADRSPYRFSFDTIDHLRASNEIDDNGWEIGIIYHSHTHSPAYPSATDVRLVTYPDAYYLIVSLSDPTAPDVRMYSIQGSVITEEPIKILE